MTAHMDLEILQTTEALFASIIVARIRLFARVNAHMDEQLVASVEFLLVALALGPQTKVSILLARLLIHVLILQVLNERLHVQKGVLATLPLAHLQLRFELLELLLLLLLVLLLVAYWRMVLSI